MLHDTHVMSWDTHSRAAQPYTSGCIGKTTHTLGAANSPTSEFCLWQRGTRGMSFLFLYLTLVVLDHNQAELERS